MADRLFRDTIHPFCGGLFRLPGIVPMQTLLGQIARRLGIYAPMRSMKVRLERMKPSHARHRREMGAFYGNFFKSGDLVFDIGANNGNRSEIFLELGARVVAVEPQPLCQDVLKRLFASSPRFTLVPKALGDAPGEAKMFIADASVLSTLSKDWIDKTTKSGRFAGHEWSKSITVPLTTMDALIAEHGDPSFCKIDVEGFEVQVLKGLTRPVKAVSFELATEATDNALACIQRLESLGRYEYNFSNSESMKFERTAWLTSDAMVRVIKSELDSSYFGDVYARLV